VSGIEPEESAGLHIPLPENNMGFLLMQKMGWSNGVGLGKNEQGTYTINHHGYLTTPTLYYCVYHIVAS
jgi:hypothetical protein